MLFGLSLQTRHGQWLIHRLTLCGSISWSPLLAMLSSGGPDPLRPCRPTFITGAVPDACSAQDHFSHISSALTPAQARLGTKHIFAAVEMGTSSFPTAISSDERLQPEFSPLATKITKAVV